MMYKQCRINRVFFLLVVLLTGCAVDQEHSTVKVAPLKPIEDQLSLQIHWKNRVVKGVGPFYSRLQPAYHGNKLYVADRQGNVAAMTADTGEIVWRVRLKGPDRKQQALLSGGVVVVADDQLLLTSENAEVIALQLSDGQVAWRQVVSGEIISHPLCYQGMIIIHTNNGMLQALDQQTGQPCWQQILDVPLLSLRGASSPVASAGGMVVVGGKNGRVNAFSIDQGELLWQQQISLPKGTTEIDRLNDVAAMPLIINDRVLALSYQGTLSALSLYNGQVIWQHPMSSANDFIVVGDQLVVVDQEDNIIALDSRSGTEVWRQTALRHRQLTAPTAYRNVLVVGDAQGYLHWLSLEDGELIARKKLEQSGFYTAPVVAGDQLVVQNRTGTVIAIGY